MPAVTIPFPRSSTPGETQSESKGRLINAYCEATGDSIRWRVVPGATLFVDTAVNNHRGMIVVGGALYTVQGNDVIVVSSEGVQRTLTGEFLGGDRVTLAANNKRPSKDVIGVSSSGGVFKITDLAVTSLEEGDLPAPNSVSMLDGFFLYTIGDGRIFASDLNATTVDPLSFTTANYASDGLIRGTVHSGQFFAWGQTSCEVYQNVGTIPFPLARATVIQTGLAGPWAIAGYEDGYDSDQVFVATDGTVRRLRGYEPIKVSTKDVERAIASVTDKSTITATAYTFEGAPVVAFSSLNWTWVYNLENGFWHERKSYGQSRWMAEDGIYFNNRWVMSRRNTGKLLYLDKGNYTEDESPISMTMESDTIKDFPFRSLISAVFLDFTTGEAPLSGTEDAVNPTVSVQWSGDGGSTWSNEISSRSLGRQGEFSQQVRVNRLGLSTHHGMRIKFTTSSPVYRSLRGGRAEYSSRNPA